MVDQQHANATDPNIHEPKDITTANSGDVYVADGANSGAWKANLNKYVVTKEIADVSTASSTFFAAPVAGKIVNIYMIVDGVITSANAVISTEINGVAVTSGDMTILFTGAAVGDNYQSTPSGTNTVSPGDKVEVITDGASSTAVKATLTYVIKVD